MFTAVLKPINDFLCVDKEQSLLVRELLFKANSLEELEMSITAYFEKSEVEKKDYYKQFVYDEEELLAFRKAR